MSIHRSLKGAEKGKQQRSVLKLIEKIKHLKDKDMWNEGDSVFGLPKIKILKIKFKKEKPVAEKTEEAGGAPAEGTTPAEGAAKPQADSKSKESSK
ncbi:small basic protein [Candidatus Omnitrophota bacterium]